MSNLLWSPFSEADSGPPAQVFEAPHGSSTFGSSCPLFCIFFTCFIRFFLWVLKPSSFL